MQFIIHVSTLIDNKGEIVLVREKKPESYGRWNLPGGHLEFGEKLITGAQREIIEEIGQALNVSGFIGIYTGFKEDHLLNIVFMATTENDILQPQANTVIEARMFSFQEVLDMDNDLILNPLKLKQIIRDYKVWRSLSLDCIREDVYEK